MRWVVIIPLILTYLMLVEHFIWWNRIIANDMPRKGDRTLKDFTAVCFGVAVTIGLPVMCALAGFYDFVVCGGTANCGRAIF